MYKLLLNQKPKENSESCQENYRRNLMISFKEKVFQIVKKIPAGKFLTYKKVAKLAGRPQAWRVVGNILNKNQDPKIPCHRVIRSDGKIGGHRDGQKRKISLLKKEGLKIKRERVF